MLNAALREILADSIGSLQRGTVNGDAPVYNTKPSSNAWLRRFDLSPDDLFRAVDETAGAVVGLRLSSGGR